MFACPFVKKCDVESLKKSAEDIKSLFAEYFGEKKISVKCVVNEDFSKEILEPLFKVGDKITEADAFLRAIQLIRTCKVTDKLNNGK